MTEPVVESEQFYSSHNQMFMFTVDQEDSHLATAVPVKDLDADPSPGRREHQAPTPPVPSDAAGDPAPESSDSWTAPSTPPPAVLTGQIDPDNADDNGRALEDAGDADWVDGEDTAAEPPSATTPPPPDAAHDHGAVGDSTPDHDSPDRPGTTKTSRARGAWAAITASNPRYDKRIALGFASATAVAALVASGTLLALHTTPHVAATDHSVPSTHVSIAAAPSTTAAGASAQDAVIPYTATSVGCLPGSTAAQAAAGSDPTQAWVCVSGGNVGQYVVLNLGRSMLVTAVALTPGWVGTDASGADQWHQHRVLTRVQWSFNDSPPTVLTHDTGSAHGQVTKALPERGVLASRVILLVQETARAPADAATPTSSAPGGAGLFDDLLGPPASPAAPNATALPGEPNRTDPADNSFAVSSIKIFGHLPQ
ncbi:hypothetical protein [Mycobacterium asiaticum]|uniref:F5/8 type C domain-containing protein n=1 Tax=Mycobacterium asiaticum TaxID=1790 RepID=A0A1A3L181_MYCAS|nr:hypothetical protein [Mycobacterium asiaticum]OBJ90368.1 hypothetical protein A5640_24780 [Mycobacterium asiaticum]